MSVSIEIRDRERERELKWLGQKLISSLISLGNNYFSAAGRLKREESEKAHKSSATCVTHVQLESYFGESELELKLKLKRAFANALGLVYLISLSML